MEFTVELYESVTGGCPVQEFLDELKETDPGDFAAVMAGLANFETDNIIDRLYPRALEMIFLNCDM